MFNIWKKQKLASVPEILTYIEKEIYSFNFSIFPNQSQILFSSKNKNIEFLLIYQEGQYNLAIKDSHLGYILETSEEDENRIANLVSLAKDKENEYQKNNQEFLGFNKLLNSKIENLLSKNII